MRLISCPFIPARTRLISSPPAAPAVPSSAPSLMRQPTVTAAPSTTHETQDVDFPGLQTILGYMQSTTFEDASSREATGESEPTAHESTMRRLERLESSSATIAALAALATNPAATSHPTTDGGIPLAHEDITHGITHGMCDMVELQDENGQIRLVPRRAAIQAGGAFVGSVHARF